MQRRVTDTTLGGSGGSVEKGTEYVHHISPSVSAAASVSSRFHWLGSGSVAFLRRVRSGCTAAFRLLDLLPAIIFLLLPQSHAV
jgi:hypothetical protein